jgi:hypothetical protein
LPRSKPMASKSADSFSKSFFDFVSLMVVIDLIIRRSTVQP